MSANRPTEAALTFSLSSTLPVGDTGNATVQLDGAMGVVYETTAASSGTGAVEIQFAPSGDWHPWPAYEYASGAGTMTARGAGVTITLADNDILFVPCPGAYACRFNLGGTSASLYGRTCETLRVSDLVALAAASVSDPTTMAIRVLDSDGAQTNVAMVTVSAGTRIEVTRYAIMMDGSNSAPYNGVLGFAAATLATPNTTSGAGILQDGQGISAGQGVAMGDGTGVLGVGADGEDLRYTMEDPAGGSGTISVTYRTRTS